VLGEGEEEAAQARDPQVRLVIEGLGDAIRDSMMGVEWKSEIPTTAALAAAFVSGEGQERLQVQATIVQRVALPSERRQLPYYTYDAATGTSRQVIADWVGVRHHIH